MKRVTAFLLFVLLASAGSAWAQERAQVMMLGVYHFDNPGQDLLNIRSEGTLTPEKQKQITELIEVLKKFHPTKIAIEAPMASTKVPQQYADYRAGKYTLTANEIDQVGYRLAKELGHSKVYPIDVQFDFDFEDVAKFAGAHGQSQVVNHAMEIAKQEVAKVQEHVDHTSLVETLRFVNAPEQVQRSQSFYMMVADVNGEGQYPGAKLLGQWYQRNVMIYGNLRKIIDSPRDRVLVIYGSGHLYWLQRDVLDSSDLSLAQFGELR